MTQHRFVVLVPLVALVSVLTAKPTVRLFHPPPGMYGLERLWRVEVRNPDAQSYKVRLRGEVTEAQKGVVFTAETKEFEIAAHQTKVLRYGSPELQMAPGYPTYAKGYEQFAARTSGLPPGDYTFRVWLLPDFGEGMIRFRSMPAGPPRLVSPRNRAELQQEPVFVWTPPMPRPSGMVSYTLKLVEVLPGQSVEEALKGNPAWFMKRGIRGTTFRYPVSGRRIEKGRKFAWQVTAEASGIQPLVSEKWGFSRYQFRPGLVAKGPLSISREVTRHSNWFRVELTLTNTGPSNLSNITVTDSHRYFQCIDDAIKQRVPPPGGEQFPGWTTSPERPAHDVRSPHGGFRGAIEVDLEDWVLPPGQSFRIRYSVLPLLTFSIMGPGHTVGAGLRATYTVTGNQYARDYNSLAVDPVPGLGDAWRSANYMITSSPAKLHAANPGAAQDVEALLVTMARLARAKQGALLYLTDVPTTAATVRSACKAFGTVMKGNWQNGYLLLVGEDEIVPVWDTVTPVPDRPIPYCDHQYADLSGDDAPEVKVGRMIGTTAEDLRIGIQHSLDVHHHIGGASWNGSSALGVGGIEQVSKGDNFTKDAGEGANYLRNVKGLQASHWGMEYITSRKTVLTKALQHTPIASGGAGTSASLGSYTETQLAAWLLDITTGLPTPHPQDQPFSDSEGRSRRVPHGFADADIWDAVDQAEGIENARRTPWVNQQYGYPANVQDSTAAQLRIRLPYWQLLLFSAHGGDGGSNFDRLNTSVVNTIDFTSEGTRPVIVSFTCFLGDYGQHTGTIARAFQRQGAAVHICYAAMTNTGWYAAGVGAPHTFLQFWAKNKRVGDVFWDWKQWLASDPAQDARLVPGYNLYGDPKLGGK
jgi:hypothetical protein